MPDNPRILELRRRVDADPSSIAFAQLAEEYRRVGNLEEAERVCREGLARHPGYLSARVTLGRTLVERGNLDAAMHELQCVLDSAPDNLPAIRGIADIYQRRGDLEQALQYYHRALPLARHDPELEETVNQINRELGGVKTAPAANPGTLSFEEAQNELMNAVLRLAEAAPPEALAQTPMVFAPPVLAASPVDAASPVHLGPPVNTGPAVNSGRAAGAAPPTVDIAPPLDLAALISSVRTTLETPSGSAAETQPAPEPEPEPQLEASVAAAPPSSSDDQPGIDFDELLNALGRTDQSAPPQVEALLTGATGAAGAEGEVRIAGVMGAPAAPEHRNARLPDAQSNVAARSGQAAPDGPDRRRTASAEPPAPTPPDAPGSERAILAELEAWLAALKR